LELKADVGNLQAGEFLPVHSHLLTRSDLVAYAGASGDMSPVHHDDTFARSVGLIGVFGHGMFTMGLLASVLEDHLGVGSLMHLQVRFTEQTWPDHVLQSKISVRGRRDSNGADLVDLDVAVVQVIERREVEVLRGVATAVICPVR
jgi:acyl dehydratase